MTLIPITCLTAAQGRKGRFRERDRMMKLSTVKGERSATRQTHSDHRSLSVFGKQQGERVQPFLLFFFTYSQGQKDTSVSYLKEK